MKVVIRSAERQKPALFSLLQHHPSDHAKRGLRHRDGPVVLEPYRHVKSDGPARQPAIVRGTIESIVGGPIANAMSRRRRSTDLAVSSRAPSSAHYRKSRGCADRTGQGGGPWRSNEAGSKRSSVVRSLREARCRRT
ncbi:MAG TPA: hypothetical protein VM925_17165, partial [Labilithrix sp.]|nr:hypothetical protein [Labilithrix sp.]